LAKPPSRTADPFRIIQQGMAFRPSKTKETVMTWNTPAYCEIRLGFEVTAYVYVR